MQWEDNPVSPGGYIAHSVFGPFHLDPHSGDENVYNLKVFDRYEGICLELEEGKRVAQEYLKIRLEPALEEIDLNAL